MKIVKITLKNDMVIYAKFSALERFKAEIVDIVKLEGIEMSEEKYNKIPASNQVEMLFEK